jgi:hypothetical protein
MKTILRILTILVIGALVSGEMYLILQNTIMGSAMSGAPNFDQASATVAGESSQLPARLEGGGDRNAASLDRGLPEVLVSLAKLAGITLLVLLVQSVLDRLQRLGRAKMLAD